MKTIKPMKVGVLCRNYEFRRRFYFAVDVLLFIPLGDQTSLIGEIPMWKFLAEELGGSCVIDEVIPKQNAEYLVKGHAYPPREDTPNKCLVRARVGDLEKTLYVFGDRTWERKRFTEPEPFSGLPVDWEHAYGGEKFKRNPVGKGHRPVEKVHALPNVEYPKQLVTSPKKDADPASFLPIDLTWPQRFKKAGTYKKKWLAEEFPGVASDIDWTFFNLASDDQQRREPFRAGEAYSFENMHATEPLVSGRIPNLVGCCHINLKTPEGEVFQPIETKLSTLWFFPHARRGVLIFQGVVETREEDGSDVLQMLISAEEGGKPKGIEHYRDVLARRLDKDEGHIASLRDQDLLPDCIEAADPELAEEMKELAGEGLAMKRQRVRAEREIEEQREVVASFGLDLDEHAIAVPPPAEAPPTIEELPEKLAELHEIAEEEKRKNVIFEAEQEERLREVYEKMGLDFELFLAEKHYTPQGPPPFNAEGELQELEEMARQSASQGFPNVEIESMVENPDRLRESVEAEKEMADVYRMGAHTKSPSFSLSEEKSAYLRESVKRAFADRRSLAGYDLTGADLSRLELRGVDFEGAFLESVRFDSADLTGANFKKAVLAHASMAHSRCERADFSGANLGAANLTGAGFADTDLTDATLVGANLTKADLRRAKLQGANLQQAEVRGANLSGVDAFQMLFIESDFTGVVLTGARLEKCLFLNAEMSGVDFSGTHLETTTFMHAKGLGARFQGAWIKGGIFTGDCSFPGADFRDAFLDGANLRGIDLRGADFSRARMDGADFSEADLTGARLYRSVAREARFTKSILTDAVMTSANLMQASLAHARLYGTDLRGVNLFGGDFARVRQDERTRRDGALTKKLREVPKWEDPA